MREKALIEMCKALTFGAFITMFIFAFCHQMFRSPVEAMGFWIGTWAVAVYAVWSVIDWIDRKTP